MPPAPVATVPADEAQVVWQAEQLRVPLRWRATVGKEFEGQLADGGSFESVAATERVLELARGLGPDDLLLCAFTGGGSALLCAPAEGVPLDDKIEAVERLRSVSVDTRHPLSPRRRTPDTASPLKMLTPRSRRYVSNGFQIDFENGAFATSKISPSGFPVK